MKLRPLHNQVIIRRNQSEEKIAGGLLFAPQSFMEKSFEGEVLAVGPGKYSNAGVLVEMTVKPGDVVLFTKFSNQEIKFDEEDYLVMNEEAILAVLDRE